MRIGIDIIKVSRFAKLAKNNEFLNKYFCQSELDHFYQKKHLQTLAGIFCAKEAFLKAVGFGFANQDINVKSIKVIHNEYGKPQILLEDKTKKELNIKQMDLSISHDDGLAIAVCVIGNG